MHRSQSITVKSKMSNLALPRPPGRRRRTGWALLAPSPGHGAQHRPWGPAPGSGGRRPGSGPALGPGPAPAPPAPGLAPRRTAQAALGEQTGRGVRGDAEVQAGGTAKGRECAGRDQGWGRPQMEKPPSSMVREDGKGLREWGWGRSIFPQDTRSTGTTLQAAQARVSIPSSSPSTPGAGTSTSIPQFPAKAISSRQVMRPPSLTSWPEQRRRSGERRKMFSQLGAQTPRPRALAEQATCESRREDSASLLSRPCWLGWGRPATRSPQAPSPAGPHSPSSSPCVTRKARTKFSGTSRSGGCSPSCEKHWARAVPPSRCCPGLRGTYSSRPGETGKG